jgi:hypothetical protein
VPNSKRPCICKCIDEGDERHATQPSDTVASFTHRLLLLQCPQGSAPRPLSHRHLLETVASLDGEDGGLESGWTAQASATTEVASDGTEPLTDGLDVEPQGGSGLARSPSPIPLMARGRRPRQRGHVTSLPLKRMVSLNQNHYDMPLSK